jgi:hypothetical protein
VLEKVAGLDISLSHIIESMVRLMQDRAAAAALGSWLSASNNEQHPNNAIEQAFIVQYSIPAQTSVLLS